MAYRFKGGLIVHTCAFNRQFVQGAPEISTSQRTLRL
jgi:hypothetical protein